MTLIEGIGDEVVHFFVALMVVIVAAIAWWTTSISESRQTQTVWLLDRRRIQTHQRLTNHTQTVTINEGTSDSSVVTEGDQPSTSQTTTSIDDSTPASTVTPRHDDVDEEDEDEQSQIVETMDSDANSMLRQRRLAFYTCRTTSGSDLTHIPPEEVIMEHNYASMDAVVDDTHNELTTNELPSPYDQQSNNSTDTNIRIKLKYINDDLKLVDGKLQEQLGDFKKRHFHDELSSNKLVRLIFNGQVLQPDTQTLQGCGFFDNCVVHCLIHQRRVAAGTTTISGDGDLIGTSMTETNSNNNVNNHQGQGQPHDWDLGSFLYAAISFMLVSAWYFRYVYAHLYTITATVALLLLTGIFSIALISAHFPDHDNVQPRRENAQPL